MALPKLLAVGGGGMINNVPGTSGPSRRMVASLGPEVEA